MPEIKINKERCKGCQLCIVYCSKGCIAQDKALNNRGIYPVLFSDGEDKCTGCSFCAIICPDGCIEVFRGEDQGEGLSYG